MLYQICKSIFDFLLGILGFFCMAIVFLILVPFYLFSSENRGPIFYKQQRIGKYGKPFYMYKFRSMVVNADGKLKSDEKLYKLYILNNYKLEPDDDPRITGLGQFLRRTSLDELPQFINVLKGEMSLVGPRPVVKDELCEYDKKKLLSVKPGIMGLWQAQGRSNIGYPERADIEMRYVDNASMFFDFKILIKNILVVIKKDGAY